MNNPTYWDEYRQSLLAKQLELLATKRGRLILGASGGLEGGDLMDQALAESEATLDARLSQAKRSLLRAIEWALVRLKKGNHGICIGCGDAISPARLKALPWADHCRDCMEQAGA